MGKTRCTIHEQVTQESEVKAASDVASNPPPPFPPDMNATLLQTFHDHDLKPMFLGCASQAWDDFYLQIEWWASIDASTVSELKKDHISEVFNNEIIFYFVVAIFL